MCAIMQSDLWMSESKALTLFTSATTRFACLFERSSSAMSADARPPGREIRGSRGSETIGWIQHLRDSILVGMAGRAIIVGGCPCVVIVLIVFGAISGVADLH